MEEDYGEIFRKLESGEEMDEWERRNLTEMAYGYESLCEYQKDMAYVNEIEGNDHRWQKEVTVVFRYKGVLYAIMYMRGLTESQENDYPRQPYRVKEVQKTKVYTEYIKTEEESESEQSTSLSPAVWVEQPLILRERLAPMKAYWEAKLEEIRSYAPTEENLAAIRAFRAEAKKRLEASKSDMNAAIKPATDAVKAVNDLFKEYVADSQKEVDEVAKAKEIDIESTIVQPCAEAVRDFYEELCMANGIDFVPFERTGVKIGLTEARQKTQPPKKVAEALRAFVERIRAEVETISGMDNAPEIMAEYKQNLNLPTAIATVKERHARIEAEKISAQQRQEQEDLVTASVAAVEEAAAEYGPPTVIVAPEQQARFPRDFRFVIHFMDEWQFEAVRPVLKQLKEILEKEGISYE